MKIISGFRVYRFYITLKAHFQGKADITAFDYNPFRFTYATYLDNKGLNYFEWLATKLRDDSTTINFFITAFLLDNTHTIYSICDDYETIREKMEIRLGKIEKMAYHFKKDCKYLIDAGWKFDKDMGNFLLNQFLSSNIELETFIILRKMFNFSLDGLPDYEYIYRDMYERYELFFSIDMEKYKTILEEAIM